MHAKGSLEVALPPTSSVPVRGPAMGLSLADPSGFGLVLACAAAVWRVWTRSLTRPVSCTVRRSTGDSAGALGLFCVDADSYPFGSEDGTPGSRACVRVLALVGRVGRAGLAGAFWGAIPFLWPFCPSAFLGPPRAGVALVVFLYFVFFASFFLFPFLVARAPAIPGLLCFLASGALGLGAQRFFSAARPPSRAPPPPSASSFPLFFPFWFLLSCFAFRLFLFLFFAPPPFAPPPPCPLPSFRFFFRFRRGGGGWAPCSFSPPGCLLSPLLCVFLCCCCVVPVLLLVRWVCRLCPALWRAAALSRLLASSPGPTSLLALL